MDFHEVVINAVDAVIKQGKASVNEHDACCYRGPEGLKCAVGHIIPDAAVKYVKEGDSAVSAVCTIECAGFHVIGMKARLSHDQLDVLSALQLAHDAAARLTQGKPQEFVEEFKHQLRANPLVPTYLRIRMASQGDQP